MTNLRNAIKSKGGYSTYIQSLLDAFGGGFSKTPIQEEVTPDAARSQGWIAFGTVRQCLDGQKAGRLLVDSEAFSDGPESCDYVSPVGGAGYGFFALPGIGATVLIGKTSFGDPVSQNFWMGCLYAAGQRELPDMKTQPYLLGDPDQVKKIEIDDSGDPPQTSPTVSYGIPNEHDVYRDNDLPDSFVLKHPSGHSISLTDKNSPERQLSQVKLKTAGNKKLILDDSPAPAGESITLIDENDNQIKISSDDDSISTYALGDIETLTVGGGSHHVVSESSEEDYSISNLGRGNINITSHIGSISLLAETSITLKCGTSTITINPDSVDIDAGTVNITGNAVNITGNTGITGHTGITGGLNVDSLDFGTHVHLGDSGGTTGPPIPLT